MNFSSAKKPCLDDLQRLKWISMSINSALLQAPQLQHLRRDPLQGYNVSGARTGQVGDVRCLKPYTT